MQQELSFRLFVLQIKKFIAAVILVSVTGCTVTLVSDYDEQTDQSVTKLQKELETFFVTIEGQTVEECKLENHEKFYADAKVSLSAIELRAKAIPKNDITEKQVALLADSFNDLEEIHATSCPNADLLRGSFNQAFLAILTFEIAKKRGEN